MMKKSIRDKVKVNHSGLLRFCSPNIIPQAKVFPRIGNPWMKHLSLHEVIRRQNVASGNCKGDKIDFEEEIFARLFIENTLFLCRLEEPVNGVFDFRLRFSGNIASVLIVQKIAPRIYMYMASVMASSNELRNRDHECGTDVEVITGVM